MSARARKPLEEPSAINRLLTSPVTESWQRTLCACVVLLALAVLALATATAGAVLVGAPITDSLHELTGTVADVTGGR